MSREALCSICARLPSAMNSAVAQCSHVDCQHRRGVHDFSSPVRWTPPKPPGPSLDDLFDKAQAVEST